MALRDAVEQTPQGGRGGANPLSDAVEHALQGNRVRGIEHAAVLGGHCANCTVSHPTTVSQGDTVRTACAAHSCYSSH